MPRTTPRPQPRQQLRLEPCQARPATCGGPLWVAYHGHRRVQTLMGLIGLTVVVRRCPNPTCPRYHQPDRPEAAGR